MIFLLPFTLETSKTSEMPETCETPETSETHETSEKPETSEMPETSEFELYSFYCVHTFTTSTLRDIPFEILKRGVEMEEFVNPPTYFNFFMPPHSPPQVSSQIPLIFFQFSLPP